MVESIPVSHIFIRMLSVDLIQCNSIRYHSKSFVNLLNIFFEVREISACSIELGQFWLGTSHQIIERLPYCRYENTPNGRHRYRLFLRWYDDVPVSSSVAHNPSKWKHCSEKLLRFTHRFYFKYRSKLISLGTSQEDARGLVHLVVTEFTILEGQSMWIVEVKWRYIYNIPGRTNKVERRRCSGSALSTGHLSIQFIHVAHNGSVNCVLLFPTHYGANGHSKHMKTQLGTFSFTSNSYARLFLIRKVHIKLTSLQGHAKSYCRLTSLDLFKTDLTVIGFYSIYKVTSSNEWCEAEKVKLYLITLS